jgi:DNA topoisomerase-1
MNSKEKADLAKVQSESITGYYNAGLLGRQTSLREIKTTSQETGLGTNVTDEMIEAADDEVQPPMQVEEAEARAGTETFGEEHGDTEPEKTQGGKDSWFGRAWKRITGARDADFVESEHPRADDGRFGDKAGAHSAKTESKSGHLEAHESRESWPEHIKALRLPPAWKDVRVSSDPHADLLAIGKDAKGRSQYVYSERFQKSQAALKFSRIQSLQKDKPLIEEQIGTLRKSREAKISNHADCANLILKMGIRPGSDTDTKSKLKAYGATTLEGKHVIEEDGKTYLRFIGKDGVSLNLEVLDKELALNMRKRAFEAEDNGRIFEDVSDSSLRDFIHSKLDHGGYKTKDFRTLLANDLAANEISSLPTPKSEKEYKKAVMEVAKRVSVRLGNTPTIALQSYINPVVFGGWRSAYAS